MLGPRILSPWPPLRGSKRLTNRLAASKLRFPDACIENIDFAAHRGLDRRNTMSLARGAWLKAHENMIITGQAGTSKTWLACAFGRQAARLDHSIVYLRMPRAFEGLGLARLGGRFPRLVDKLARIQLRILDDLGTHTLHRSTTPRRVVRKNSPRAIVLEKQEANSSHIFTSRREWKICRAFIYNLTSSQFSVELRQLCLFR
ncbi:ATP-binding protein [Rhizobium sp. Leaf341]|uniref:ATP-binding protein n=1 Tax=Rhizobium sp. Leaf341 TaxID=1736344 RepID=UPI000ACF4CDD|nr:ATP-binding protein [Rhizobium sp. Leaf341]